MYDLHLKSDGGVNITTVLSKHHTNQEEEITLTSINQFSYSLDSEAFSLMYFELQFKGQFEQSKHIDTQKPVMKCIIIIEKAVK